MIFGNVNPTFLIAGATFLAFNLVVTWALIRDDGATVFQKSLQFFVIWLLPVLGGALILALVGSHHTRAEMRSMVPFPFTAAENNQLSEVLER
ncbi:MAG: hypothetical protein RLN85_11245 [Pseudomonadales bacterium]